MSFMEKATEENSSGYLKRFLAMIKANAGQVEEARSIFSESAQKLPASMKTVRYFLSTWPFKDHHVLKNIAEGYVKSGLPGGANDFYKISNDNRLTSNEIEKMFFGKSISGITLFTKKSWHIKRSQKGEATIIDNGKSDQGKSWIVDDMLCNQWDNLYEGLKDCWVIYRNPEGTVENQDEFLGLPGYGVFPFSLQNNNREG